MLPNVDASKHSGLIIDTGESPLAGARASASLSVSFARSSCLERFSNRAPVSRTKFLELSINLMA